MFLKMRLKIRPKNRKWITVGSQPRYRMSDQAFVSLLAFTTYVWSTAGNLGPLLLPCSDF